jgi:flagellar hook protein FlgE
MSLIGIMGSGVSALRTFEKGLEVIGNNIANVNTTGFKGSSVEYADSFSNVLQQSTSNATSGSNTIAIGTGVGIAGITTDFGQGQLSSTGNSTDLGISGNGFFTVKSPTDGTTFVTRAGNFSWDSNGYLVNLNGERVQGVTGAGTVGDIKLGTPPAGTQLTSATIDKSGNVVEFYSDGSSATTNQLLLQSFSNPAALVAEGNNLFSGMAAAGPTSGSTTLSAAGANDPGTNGLGSIQSGSLELSNVDLTAEFSNLITAQRSFQAGSRLITVSDTVLDDIVNLKQR